MTVMTKTIEVFSPSEKIPAKNHFIALVKGYDYKDDDGNVLHIDNYINFGTYTNDNKFYLIDTEGSTAIMNKSEFIESVIEWYYLPVHGEYKSL